MTGLSSTGTTNLGSYLYRFRERQKEKSRQDQSKVEELTMQLQRLQAEKGVALASRTAVCSKYV